MSLVSLSFDYPTSGWLPMRLVIGDTVLNLEPSDVPNNAVEELYDALAATAAGRGGGVWWHEEPSGHWMELSATADDQVRLRLWFRAHADDLPGRLVAECQGSRRDVLLPLWRGLRQFASFELSERAWSATLYADFPARVLSLRAAIVPDGAP